MPRAPPSNDEMQHLRGILTPLVHTYHLTQGQILTVLAHDYANEFPFSARTLRTRLHQLGLSTAQPHTLDDPAKRRAFKLMKKYHTRRLHQAEVVDLIKTRHELPAFSQTMLKKISHSHGLNWRLDDIDLGVIDFDDLANLVLVRKDRLGDSNAGLRRLTNIMAVNMKLRIKRETMNVMLHALDPDGIQLRLSGRLKRRQFHVAGPDMIWSLDGHDKLKPYGICMYGCIDAWSRKLISLDVGSNNNNPRRIGVYYLHSIARAGGIPQKTSTDHGTETLDIAQHQMLLQYLFGGVPLSEVALHHLFTTSTRNQKIEMLWSQLMRAKNAEIRQIIEEAIESGVYNDAIPLQK